jgi:hypothetical protein
VEWEPGTASAADRAATLINWREYANCIGKGTERFFPEDAISVEPETHKICAQCFVKSDCLNHAIQNGMQGIWGGVLFAHNADTRKRQRLRIARAQKA